MKIKIRETAETKTLAIRNRDTGIDWTQDLIGNAGAFADGQFVWSDEDDAHLCDQETYDWWDQYINDYETTEDDMVNLAKALNIDLQIIRERVGQYQDNDYEQHRSRAIYAMNDLRSEYAED